MSGLKLFYSPGACSLAPHIALEETGAAFDAVLVNMKNNEQKAPAYLSVNPKGRVPALADGDFVITENAAILQYIALSFPDAGLWPTTPRDQARVAEWMGWIASTIHIAYAHIRRAERYATSESALADVRAKGAESCREVWTAVEARLGAGQWLLGERYTVADANLLVFWNWGAGAVLGYDMAQEFPAWTAHARRMAARPAVQRAFAREGLPLPA